MESTLKVVRSESAETPKSAADYISEAFEKGRSKGNATELGRELTTREKAAEALGKSAGRAETRKAIRATVRTELEALGLVKAKARRSK